MKPSAQETELPPSTQLRKEVFGGDPFMKALHRVLLVALVCALSALVANPSAAVAGSTPGTDGIEGFYICEISDGMSFTEIAKINPKLKPPTFQFDGKGSVIVNMGGKRTVETYRVEGNRFFFRGHYWDVKDNTITFGKPPVYELYRKGRLPADTPFVAPNFSTEEIAIRCKANLRQFHGAKQQWALENKKPDTAVPTGRDLRPYLSLSQDFTCPGGGTYAFNAVSEYPTCSVSNHKIPDTVEANSLDSKPPAAVAGESGGPENENSRFELRAKEFLTAVQKNDLETLFRISAMCQGHVEGIHKSKPEVLWPKLTQEYYKSWTNKFLTVTGSPMYDAQWASLGLDMPYGIREARELLDKNPKIKILEVKEGDPNHLGVSAELYVKQAYLSLAYESAASSPIQESKRLKSTILEMGLISHDATVIGLSRVNGADEFWDETATATPITKPNPTGAAAESPSLPQVEASPLASATVTLPPFAYVVCPGATKLGFHHKMDCKGYYEGEKCVAIWAGKRTADDNPFPATRNLIHAGVDIWADAGKEIFPIADGVVENIVRSKVDPSFNALGYMVIIRHNEPAEGKPTWSIYLHMLDSPFVGKEERVMAGKTKLGLVGATGSAAAEGIPHIHFEIRHFKDPIFEKWGNIYWKEGTSAPFIESEFADKWINPENFSLATASAVSIPTPHAVTPNPSPTASPSASPSTQILTLDPAKMLDDCWGDTGKVLKNGKHVTGVLRKPFTDKYQGKTVKYSGIIKTVKMAEGEVVFTTGGNWPKSYTVKASFGPANISAVVPLKEGQRLTIQGTLNELSPPLLNVGLLGAGPSNTIKIKEATVIVEAAAN